MPAFQFEAHCPQILHCFLEQSFSALYSLLNWLVLMAYLNQYWVFRVPWALTNTMYSKNANFFFDNQSIEKYIYILCLYIYTIHTYMQSVCIYICNQSQNSYFACLSKMLQYLFIVMKESSLKTEHIPLTSRDSFPIQCIHRPQHSPQWNSGLIFFVFIIFLYACVVMYMWTCVPACVYPAKMC